MLAFSKVDLLAIFKNFLNSFLEIEPEPFAKGGQVCSPQKVDHQYD